MCNQCNGHDSKQRLMCGQALQFAESPYYALAVAGRNVSSLRMGDAHTIEREEEDAQLNDDPSA